jgi:hypothetical protein
MHCFICPFVYCELLCTQKCRKEHPVLLQRAGKQEYFVQILQKKLSALISKKNSRREVNRLQRGRRGYSMYTRCFSEIKIFDNKTCRKKNKESS